MRELRFSTQFKKDWKRFRHDRKKAQALKDVLDYLERGEQIPDRYKPHMLTGNYSNCMECHIGPDFLLIWLDENQDITYLLRLGSHSELFG